MRISILILLVLLVGLVQNFQEIHDDQKLMAYYEKQSSKPILHVYYNRHFKNSTQFKQFENIVNELYDNNRDYLDILFTDCNKDKQLKLSTCKKMSVTKDNRQITGTMPSGQFRRLGDKLIQNPPTTHVLQNKRDVYQYNQIKQFMDSLTPNFYKQLNNLQQYNDFLQPRYSPKLIAFITDQQSIPMVMKQIAVAYFLKFDFAYITDLTEQLVKQFQVKEYPSFVVVRYNFNQSKHQYYYSPKVDLIEQNYYTIKQFLDPYALAEPRNDLLFHKIQVDTKSQIYTVQTDGQLEELKERTPGWLIIASSEGPIPQKLFDYKQKYDRYFTYVNFVHEPTGKLDLYNPTENITFPLQGQLQFNSLNFQNFKSNMTVWLSKDMVVLGVVQDHAHVCGLAEKPLFRGHVRCLIISNEDKKLLQQFMKIDFTIGFIARTQKDQKSDSESRETKGVKIMNDKYDQIYRDLDYATRLRLKQSLDEYLKKPVSQPKNGAKVQEACFHPFKKCIFLVTNLGKQDRTLQTYLKQIAFDYMNSFIVYELDIQKNPQFIRSIGGIKDKKADLIVYNPKTDQVTKLGKKITKNLISQFMNANLKNDKRLKREKIVDFNQIILNRRSSKKVKVEVEEIVEQPQQL